MDKKSSHLHKAATAIMLKKKRNISPSPSSKSPWIHDRFDGKLLSPKIKKPALLPSSHTTTSSVPPTIEVKLPQNHPVKCRLIDDIENVDSTWRDTTTLGIPLREGYEHVTAVEAIERDVWLEFVKISSLRPLLCENEKKVEHRSWQLHDECFVLFDGSPVTEWSDRNMMKRCIILELPSFHNGSRVTVQECLSGRVFTASMSAMSACCWQPPMFFNII